MGGTGGGGWDRGGGWEHPKGANRIMLLGLAVERPLLAVGGLFLSSLHE